MTSYYFKRNNNVLRKLLKLAGVGFVFLGASFFLYFFFPVISYQIFIAKVHGASEIEVPIPKYLVAKKSNNLGSLVTASITSLTTDYTDARNWYPNLVPQPDAEVEEEEKVESYSLSIPKLKIENAEVSTQDYDLEKHLVQYLGTSIPGVNGTAVIFGHSTLPQLFNPSNYKTIFANAHILKVGDEIFTNVKGITYKYKIFSIVITDPEDVNILSQSYDHSYLTLVTCTPPGTIWKRLIVRATLDTVQN